MTILHSDANCFYASVEMVENPSLREQRIAVCGDTQQRHGIVLTANYPAKRAGVKTAMANWEARQKCPDLIMLPPRYDLYLKYSRLLRRIYQRHSARVEPFGMDECWIGLPFEEKQSIEIAETIRRTVREETGLTVSIGVSFCKALAKLGSDMKKPDGLTVLNRSNFREKCWGLPVSELLYVGPRTTLKLYEMGITTIGALAQAPIDLIQRRFGKNGLMVRAFARGEDLSPVAPKDFVPQIKSIGHGATCVCDLHDNYSVWLALYELAQDVGHRMISHEVKAGGAQLYIKDNEFAFQRFSVSFLYPTQSPLILAQALFERFCAGYSWERPVRALTVTAVALLSQAMPEQVSLFGDYSLHDRRGRSDRAVDELRGRFGPNIIRAASLIGKDQHLATDKCEIVPMPGMMYR